MLFRTSAFRSFVLAFVLSACQTAATPTLTAPPPKPTLPPTASAVVTPTATEHLAATATSTRSAATPTRTEQPSPTATTRPTFTRNLSLQSPPITGDDVRWLQQSLIGLGYFEVGQPDGSFGPQTDAAVRRFQREHGLVEDGVVGPVTWDLLTTGVVATARPATPQAVAPTSPPAWSRSLSLQTPALKGADVFTLQTRLVELGYFWTCGQLDAVQPDAVFGARTDSAVRAFQSRAGLTVDGIVSDVVWAAIFNTSAPRSLKEFVPPALSPAPEPAQHGLLAFATDGGIFTLNLDGTRIVPLATGAGWYADPTWSPDGKRLAFVQVRLEDESQLPEVFVMNADGSSLTQMTCLGGAVPAEPAWSPDGSQIVFATLDSLWLVRLDGTPARKLTTDCCHYESPTFSPDGSRIAYVFSDDTTLYSDIWLMNVDGSERHPITSSGHFAQVDWSPDGSRLVASDGDLFVLNADGSGLTRLTANKIDAIDPAWSPDGTRIAFSMSAGGPSQIWVINADGSGLFSFNGTGADRDPDWQP